MDIQELYKYKGISPFPDDFDEFWDEEVKKADKYFKEKLQYKLIEKNFEIPFAKCYDLYFKSIDGSEIYSKLIVPSNIENRKIPFLMKFHGYQGQGSDWSRHLGLVASGMGLVVPDVRGQAGKSKDNGVFEGITVRGHIVRGLKEGKNKIFYKSVFLDMYLLSKIIENLEYTDKDNIKVFGESQGGALAAVCAGLNPNIKESFIIYPFLSDYKKVVQLKVVTDAYIELYRYFKFIDPFHETEEEVFDTLSYIDIKNFAHRIQGNTIFIASLMDDVCPPETQFAVYNNLVCNKKLFVLPEYAHEAINVKVEDMVYNWATGSSIGEQSNKYRKDEVVG